MIKFLRKIWKDPVGSNVIGAGVVGLIVLVYTIMKKFISNLTWAESFNQTLTINFNIPVWILLLVTIMVIVGLLIYRKYKFSNKRNDIAIRIDKLIGGHRNYASFEYNPELPFDLFIEKVYEDLHEDGINEYYKFGDGNGTALYNIRTGVRYEKKCRTTLKELGIKRGDVLELEVMFKK